MSKRIGVSQPTLLQREHISVLLASLEAAFPWRELCWIFWEAAQCLGSLPAPRSTVSAERTCDPGHPGTDPHAPQGTWLYCHPPLCKSHLRLAGPQILTMPSDLSSCLLLAQAVLIPDTTFMPWGCALHMFWSCE